MSFPTNSSNPPMVDPRQCSEEELQGIIDTDPTASPAYSRELTARKRRNAEVEHWETLFED